MPQLSRHVHDHAHIAVTSYSILFKASASVKVKFVNDIPQMREDIDEANDRIDDFYIQLSELTSRLDNTISRLEDIENLLDLTVLELADAYAWLQNVNDQLEECYQAHNLTADKADKVEALMDEVSSVRNSLATFQTSLENMSSSLNLTRGEVAEIQAILDEIDDDLCSVEGGLNKTMTDLRATEKKVAEMDSDPMAMILGGVGNLHRHSRDRPRPDEDAKDVVSPNPFPLYSFQIVFLERLGPSGFEGSDGRFRADPSYSSSSRPVINVNTAHLAHNSQSGPMRDGRPQA